MKKVLIYFNSLQPSGGIERVIATLSNKLTVNYQVTVLVKDEPISFYPLNDKIKILSLNNPLTMDMDSQLSRILTVCKSFIKTYQSLKVFLSKNQYDYYYVGHPLNALEFHLARGIDNKTVLTEHGSHTAYNTIYKKIKNWLYTKAKAYVVPTKTDTKLYEGMKFPAVYIPHFRSELEYENAKRQNKTILTVGRFTAVKQQLILLNVWNEIVKQHPNVDWKLQIAGSGELQDDMEAFIAQHNLSHTVQILPPIREVDKYYKSASFFVLTSSSEGFGMVLLEAISFGLPCISFDCPSGPRDMITNDVNGMLIEQNNQLQLKNAMIKLMDDEIKLNIMGENAYKDSFNWADDVVLNKWINILN